ncbi:MAG TPA: hypothetical protein VGF93_22985 [Solirubrobacteraceae bacterium]|jgi:hypothetical protein
MLRKVACCASHHKPPLRPITAPTSRGGFRPAELGRELAPEGLVAYQQLQSIYLSPPTEG